MNATIRLFGRIARHDFGGDDVARETWMVDLCRAHDEHDALRARVAELEAEVKAEFAAGFAVSADLERARDRIAELERSDCPCSCEQCFRREHARADRAEARLQVCDAILAASDADHRREVESLRARLHYVEAEGLGALGAEDEEE